VTYKTKNLGTIG